MTRFSLRPMLRRLSSKHSNIAESTRSDASDHNTIHTAATAPTSPSPSPDCRSASPRRTPRKSTSLARLKDRFRAHHSGIPDTAPPSRANSVNVVIHSNPRSSAVSEAEETDVEAEAVPSAHHPVHLHRPEPATAEEPDRADPISPDLHPTTTISTSSLPDINHLSLHLDPVLRRLDTIDEPSVNPILVVEEPTPVALGGGTGITRTNHHRRLSSDSLPSHRDPLDITSIADTLCSSISARRPQSIVNSANANIVTTLIDAPSHHEQLVSTSTARLLPDMTSMLQRKIWVKRPNASATLVQIREDDLVDDVRDMILRKYANSLGRTFDSPDLTLTIITRAEHAGPRASRMLGPEEEMCRTLDSYYPGGQTVEEALIIDLPQKKTPRPSPRPAAHHSYHAMDNFRPHEEGTDYFPPMPVTIQPALPNHVAREHHGPIQGDHPRSISVLSTGTVPALPSPGAVGRRHRAEREHRPKYGRQHTSSPTILSHPSNVVAGPGAPPLPTNHLARSTRPRVDSSASEAHPPNGIPAAPPLPDPPVTDAPVTAKQNSTPSTPSGATLSSAAHAHRSARPRKTRKPTPDRQIAKGRNNTPHLDTWLPNNNLGNLSSVLDGSVPPINVLIVEDNIINLRILEGLMKRLKVRWQTAMNGQIAVDKWRTGGYHLVLMDIQMPVMNGLQATKEIRRLERVNGIGVFSSTPGSATENGPQTNGDDGKKAHDPEDDKLPKSQGLFKSPIIIVALTASSLQSDRHEALAAGCNDFLTKPVNFVWLERKVKEWGCMQALIDFDGWRKWKDYATKEEASKSEEQKLKEQADAEKQKIKMEKLAKLQEKQQKDAREKERKKKESLGAGEVLSPEPTVAEEPPVVVAA